MSEAIVHHGAVRIDLKEKDKKYPAQHRYFGKEHFKEVDGEVFWCVATKQGKRKRLINATTGIKHDQKKYIGTMKRTAVVDKLRELITQAYKNALGAKTCRHDKGKTRKNKLLFPENLTIQAPPIEDIDGVSMNVLCTPKALFIELVPENLSYIVDSIVAQLASGGVDKPPKPISKLFRKARDDDGNLDGGAEADAVHSAETNGGVEVDGVHSDADNGTSEVEDNDRESLSPEEDIDEKHHSSDEDDLGDTPHAIDKDDLEDTPEKDFFESRSNDDRLKNDAPTSPPKAKRLRQSSLKEAISRRD